MAGTMNLAPSVQGTIAALRANTKLGWKDILGELIDNAFDAGATRVVISLKGRELAVEDDGHGCDDLEKMLTMGRHTRTSTTKLGRWGVGLKDAAWWVGGPTRIETVHGGKLRWARIDWDNLREWTVPRALDEDPGDRHGTKIRFLAMSKERSFPSGDRLAAMLAKLGFIYSPALERGRQIVFRRGNAAPVLLKRYEMPPIVDKIETTVTVDGKTARICAGIVPEGVDNPEPGLIYTHAFRVIINGALGCGGMGSSRIAGVVELDEKWKLSRNKDDIVGSEELGEAVFKAIEDIVKKASQQAMSMQSAEFTSRVNSMFRAMLGGLAPGRRPASGAPKPEPRGKAGKRKRASQRARRAGQFRIEFKSLADSAIGEVDLPGTTVWLAENHPLVAQARSEDDARWCSSMAAMLFVVYDSDSNQPMLPALRDGSTAKRVEIAAGQLLAEQMRPPPALKAVA